ncbi:putative F-box domain-containing protein [Septoria linicola]|nr:putative F-box domain-containing protein [Septoria linicola]
MTFKRNHHEAGLTEADYDFLLPLSDPITAPSTSDRYRPAQDVHHYYHTIVPAASSTSAFSKTFGAIELAEMIFLHLPPENLLCKIQRVCRQWRDIVQSNELIQQYLFLAPIPVERHTFTRKARMYAQQHCGPEDCFDVDVEELWGNGFPQIENPWLYAFSTSYDELLQYAPHSSWKRMLPGQPTSFSLRYATLQDEGAVYLGQHTDQFPRRVSTIATCAKHKRSFLTLGDLDLGSNLARIKTWSDWKPQLSWETLRLAKKCIRVDEKFVELELASLEQTL